MTFAEVLEAYLNVGILGLCAILVVMLFYKLVIKGNSESDKKTEQIEHKDNFTENTLTTLLEMFQQQQLEYRQQEAKLRQEQLENMKQYFDDGMEKITKHVPNADETKKVSQISYKIDEYLQDILITTQADRALLVQYHNGGRGFNKQSFMKMSVTNEQVQVGIKPTMPDFKDQFRSVLAYFNKELEENNTCYINDINDIKEIDASMYEFLLTRNIKSKYGMVVTAPDGFILGFLCVEFINKYCERPDIVDRALSKNRPSIETLLNL